MSIVRERMTVNTVKVFQKGFNFSQDGPGNRLVIHLQGCNMHCPWCSNPEGMSISGAILSSDHLLDEVCPCGAISGGKLNREICSSCQKRECLGTYGAPKLSYEEYTVDSLIDEIMRCEPMFFDGGGVTFTGGEATVQFSALKELLTRLKSLGINTALETNATDKRLPELFYTVDFLITDIKHYDPEPHRIATGVSNSTVIENIRRAARERSQLLIRIPLIKSFNCADGDENGFADLLSDICTDSCSVELLRYHEYGKDKWAKCGMAYKTENGFIDDEVYLKVKKALTDKGINVINT